MTRPKVLQVLFLSVVLVAIGMSTESVFAGVHGGGGGFHGGGGFGGSHAFAGGGFHGSGSMGGWHGGRWNGGWHGGYYGGWRGGYYGGWGYPYWGGWGFGIGFNFGWPWGYYGYPYAYGYYPYYPYYYPYYPYYYAPVSAPAGYVDAAPYGQQDGYPQNVPAPQPGASAPQFAPNSSGVKLLEVTHRPPASYRTVAASASAARYRPAPQRKLPPVRAEVQNVIRALYGMPPAARQREIDSGLYNTLSPQELELVRTAAGLQ